MTAASPEKVRVRDDGRPVVQPPADVDMYTVVRLREDLAAAAALSANGDIVVDMTGVAFFDSMGLGALVGAWKRAREHSPRGHIYLVGVPHRINAVLEVTGTARLFGLVQSADQLPILRETERCA